MTNVKDKHMIENSRKIVYINIDPLDDNLRIFLNLFFHFRSWLFAII